MSDDQTARTQGVYLRVGKRSIMLKTIRTILFGMAILVVGFGLGYQYREAGPGPGFLASVTGIGKTTATPLKREGLDFSLFWLVWDELSSKYLEPDKFDPQEMVYGAIQGMTAALGDPYTVFLPPKEQQQVKEDLSGEFDGVGIQLGYKHDTLAVMAPLEEHPAIKQGVRAGDLILHIKDEQKGLDEDTTGLSLPEAVTRIRGKKGTPVTLTLYREDKGEFEVTIVRDTIKVPSVELETGDIKDGQWTKADDGQVAWLKVRRFGDNTQAEWDTAVARIVKGQDKYKGIVLDLRNNPGGYLEGAVNLASEFIPEGLVVTQEGRTEKYDYEVNKRGRLLGVPVVVLVNGGSASASEILAGALRDRLGVKLVGEQSFGKGTVQEALDLEGQAGLHVTTARWLLPSGDWIHEDGLTPDIEMELEYPEGATESTDIVDTQLKAAVEALGK